MPIRAWRRSAGGYVAIHAPLAEGDADMNHPDRHQFHGSVQPPQLLRVLAVVLALFSQAPRNQRRGHDLARVAPAPDHPLQHVARAARLVAGANLVLTGQAFQQPL